jgi:hypothetical protein
VGRRIGDIQARLLLSIVYAVVVAPFALVVQLATDPLAAKPDTVKGWRPRPASSGPSLERARQQS